MRCRGGAEDALGGRELRNRAPGMRIPEGGRKRRGGSEKRPEINAEKVSSRRGGYMQPPIPQQKGA